LKNFVIFYSAIWKQMANFTEKNLFAKEGNDILIEEINFHE
jgi:hypothetical protein